MSDKPFDMKTVGRTWAATLYVRLFGLHKIPLIFFVRPSVVEWSDERLELRIPLARRTRNHLGSMYFAVLAAGADLAAGFQAMVAIRQSGQSVALIFKNMSADFLKRAEGDVHFTCTEGAAIRELVARTVETGERVEMAVPVIATVPSKTGDEPVARFVMTLSLKRKGERRPQPAKAETGLLAGLRARVDAALGLGRPAGSRSEPAEKPAAKQDIA